MNIFVIPSWYPSLSHPSTGIFFKEQTRLMARKRPEWQLGIGLWGSHEPALWLTPRKPLTSILKFGSKPILRPHEKQLASNCVEFFQPAYTWSRKWKQGNINGIADAVQKCFERHTAYFGKPQVILAQSAYPGGFVAMTLSKKFKVPYVLVEHMTPFPMKSFQRDFKQTLLPPLRQADQVLVVSEKLRKKLAEFEISSDRISNFIDDEFFFPKPNPSGQFVFTTTGRLDTQKRMDVLLDACRILMRNQVSFQLNMIGSGRLKSRLQRKYKDLESAINWLGELNQEEVRNTLQRSHAFVLSSDHENQPVAILEAMACGLPIISTDWEGAADLISPECGVLVPRADPVSLAKIMTGYISEKPTAQVVRAYFEQQMGTKKIIQQYESLFQRLSK